MVLEILLPAKRHRSSFQRSLNMQGFPHQNSIAATKQYRFFFQRCPNIQDYRRLKSSPAIIEFTDTKSKIKFLPPRLRIGKLQAGISRRTYPSRTSGEAKRERETILVALSLLLKRRKYFFQRRPNIQDYRRLNQKRMLRQLQLLEK